MYIVCLPITIPSGVKLGLAITPFTVSAIAKLTGLAPVCCINLTGLRYEGLGVRDVSHRFEQFKKLLIRLGLPIAHYWADNDRHHISMLKKYCKTLATAGILQMRTAITLTRECGAVEVVEAAINSDWSMDCKVMYSRGNATFCKLCNTPLRAKCRDCLFLETGFSGNPLVAVPDFYQKRNRRSPGGIQPTALGVSTTKRRLPTLAI